MPSQIASESVVIENGGKLRQILPQYRFCMAVSNRRILRDDLIFIVRQDRKLN